MVKELVEKTMKKALNRFAEKEGKTANNIAFFIHTKPNEQEPNLAPKYFYSVDGETIMENGKIKDINFTNDILGKKFDFGTEAMASHFLAGYFSNVSEEIKADPRSLYVMITSADEKADNLILALYKGANILRELKLEDVFGE